MRVQHVSYVRADFHDTRKDAQDNGLPPCVVKSEKIEVPYFYPVGGLREYVRAAGIIKLHQVPDDSGDVVLEGFPVDPEEFERVVVYTDYSTNSCVGQELAEAFPGIYGVYVNIIIREDRPVGLLVSDDPYLDVPDRYHRGADIREIPDDDVLGYLYGEGLVPTKVSDCITTEGSRYSYWTLRQVDV